MFRYRSAINFQIRPLRLQPFFQPGQHPGSTSRCSGHQEMVVAQPGGDTAIEYDTVSLTQQSVAALPFRQCREHICIDAVEKNRSVRTLDIDLSEGRSIHYGHAFPGCYALTAN